MTTTNSESNINELKSKGNEAYANGEYKKATHLYRDAIMLNPKNPVLYSNRAMAFLKLENWDMVLKDADLGLTSIENDGTQSKIRVKLLWRKAVALRHKNDLNGAEKILIEAKNISPDNKSVLSEIKILNEEISASKKRKFENEIILSNLETNKLSFKSVNLQPQLQLKTEIETNRSAKSLISNNREIELTTQPLSPNTVSKISSTSIKYMEHPEVPEFETKEQTNLRTRISDTSLNMFDTEILDLEILVVDRLPADFFNLKAVKSGFDSELSKIPNASIPVKAKNIELFADDGKFPEQPTSFFLSTLGKKNENKINSYYSFVLQIPLDYYKNMFKVTGVEADFLQFYVDAAIDDLQKSSSNFENNISDQIILFTQLPRFTITSMYIPSSKVSKLMDLIYFKTGKDLKSYWA